MASPAQRLMARHPLQRLSSPSRGISALVHLTGIVSFSLSFKYLIDWPTIISESYGWHFQYLTILGLSIALATFTSGLLADITSSPFLFSLKNTLSLCSAPLEVLIAVLYWGISAIDKNLLVPPEIEMSVTADVGFHAIPALLLAVDLLFLSPPWTIRALPALGLSFVIAVSYWAWVEHCYKYNGFYPYPLFAQLDTMQRAVLFTGAALMMSGSTAMLQWLYVKINGVQSEAQTRRTGNFKEQ